MSELNINELITELQSINVEDDVSNNLRSAFIRFVGELDVTDYMSHNFNLDSDPSELGLEEVKALLTAMVRADRFSEGTLDICLSEGYGLGALYRLKDLLPA